MDLQIGDKIFVQAALWTKHYGIYVGPLGGCFHGVVHNDKYLRRVVLVELGEFLAGRHGFVESRVPGGRHARMEVAHRALALRGREYDLVNFNCEHAATLAQTGTADSAQVRVFLMLGLAALGIYACRNGARA